MNRDLTVGDPAKVLRRFCLPLFGSIIFQQLYNLADSWVVGRFVGENALAAVGNSYEITLIFLAFAFGCNIGCSVITSRFFGAKDFDKMRTAITTAMISTVCVCGVLMALGLLFGRPMLSLIHTPVEILDDSALYLMIYVLGLPFVFFYNLTTGVFSAMGDSKTPFYFLVVSSLSNIAMDICFVYNLQMGVAGVAWATFLCQGIACIASLFVLIRRMRSISFKEKWVPFSGEAFKSFLVIAIPSTLQQGFISIGNIIIQSVINGFGYGVVAGYSAGVKLNNLIITAFTTLGTGISNFTSQNLGAGKPDRLHSGYKAGLKLVWMISLPVCLLYVAFPGALLTFFMKEPSADALHSGTMFLRILAPFYFVVSTKIATDGVLRGVGKMNEFMIATFTDLLLRVGLAILLSGTFLADTGIWCAWPIGWTIATCISLYYYQSRIRKKL